MIISRIMTQAILLGYFQQAVSKKRKAVGIKLNKTTKTMMRVQKNHLNIFSHHGVFKLPPSFLIRLLEPLSAYAKMADLSRYTDIHYHSQSFQVVF